MKILTASHYSKPILSESQIQRGFSIWDITIKSGCDDGWILAPTWDMVNGIKSGELSEEEFTKQYFKLMNKRWFCLTSYRMESMYNTKAILICYCQTGVFCHRYLAADWLVKRMNAKYFGEYC